MPPDASIQAGQRSPAEAVPMAGRLRIALVHVADKGGGAERSVLTLHQSLRDQGHDCRLFVGNRYLDEPGVVEIGRERTIPGLLRITNRLEQQGVQNLYAPWFRRLPALFGDADVVHLHSLWKNRNSFADLTGIRLLAKRYPTVMTLRDGWMLTGHCACPIGCDRWKTGCGRCPDLKRPPAIETDFTRLNWHRKRKTIQRSRLHVTAVSSWLKTQIQQSPIFAGKPVHVVHNSVDSDGFQPGDRAAARRQLNIPPDRFVVLLAGQSIEGFHQGISQHAVQALNQLGDQGIHAMLVGRSAADVGATLKIPFTVVPFRNTPAEMGQCYQAADLTIVPSEYETFGRVAAESLFCGTPVLACATGGLTDIVVPGVCGRLVPTGDVEALSRNIAELKADSQILADMRSRCVAHVQDRFNTQAIAAKYVDVYRRVIAERSGAGQTAGSTDSAAASGGGPFSATWPTGSAVHQPQATVSMSTISASTAHSALSKSVNTSDVVTVNEERLLNAGHRAPGAGQSAAVEKISCIIPAWNCAPWIARAVDSLLDTGYVPLEILVIDDGSTDDTLAVARQLESQHCGIVRVLQHADGRNRGVSASRNLGMQEAAGELICFLDADDYVYPHRFDSAAAILAARPEVDGVHQLAEMIFPTEEAGNRWWKNSPYFGFQQEVASEVLLLRLLTGKCWATSAILFRRSLLDRSGLFHEALRVAEDCHLWFRMAAVGRLVSGDLTRPVSAYYRRLDSAYQPSPHQRLQMIRAMTSFLNWLNTVDVPSALRRQAKLSIGQYIRTGLTNARFEKERTLAWSIAWQGICGLPSLALDPGFFGQVARLAAGR
ncbi:MAG: glycosyltransferase [Fuerstiella sp.]